MRFGVRIACVCLLAYTALAGAPAAAKEPAADKMIAKLNQTRAKHGLKPLRSSPTLGRSAARFARWMMRRDFFAHRSRVSANHRKFRRLGEAIAMHSGRKRKIAGTVRSWLRSPPHRKFVLTRSLTWVGVGMSRGRFGGARKVIWVLQVGKR